MLVLQASSKALTFKKSSLRKGNVGIKSSASGMEDTPYGVQCVTTLKPEENHGFSFCAAELASLLHYTSDVWYKRIISKGFCCLLVFCTEALCL